VANVNATLPNPLTTTQGAAVHAGDAIVPFEYTSGTNVDASGGAYNFVDMVTPVNTAGLNAQSAYNAAFGGGHITTTATSNSVAGAFFEVTNHQAVYFVDVNLWSRATPSMWWVWFT
jgi:hypothetical protein